MTQKLPLQISSRLTLPVINAPMFLVSGPELVMESCKAGIIGSFPSLNARTPEIQDEWMGRIKEELAAHQAANPDAKTAPWAMNIVAHRTNKRLETDMNLVLKHRPPIIITSLGSPKPIVEVVHAYGGLVFSDVISLPFARKAAEAGVDGLILVCAGAGGHAGTINSFAFVEAVREFYDGLLILAGNISSGRAILAAEALGADLAYMGTRFIATKESMASDEYKQMLIDATLEDLVYTNAFTGVHANMLKPSIRKAGLDPDNLKPKNSVDLEFIENKEVKAWKDIWSAGQGVGAVKKVQPVAELVADLQREYDEALAGLCKGKRVQG
ncbi:NAD(P)H-dependent flavin oxidoreductase [Effusibacillus lacus]|uniref:NAD(P)H-dependent flavin oxidoreductase n=1 Tax=Effusibacillus lacus TaxID=1348429 RepID=UPI000BB7A902|nr:nitronate monooxygenase [Effusibacillus lacus]TCS72040.1 nitronate monooxygenase [Effusibacillus lacus]